MTIKKYTGRSRDEAIEAAKKELGSSAVIMNVKEIRKGGFLGLFSRPTFEVTAAIEEELPPRPVRPLKPSGLHFDATASDKGGVVKHSDPASGAGRKKEEGKAPAVPSDGQKVRKEDKKSAEDASALKDAFQAVNEVIRQGNIPKAETIGPTKDTIIPGDQVKIDVPQNRPKTGDSPAISSAREARPLPPAEERPASKDKKDAHTRNFVKTIYNILLKNEVDERYVNQILSDMDRVIRPGTSLDVLLGSAYQKMVLMVGKPRPIEPASSRPELVFFIGPTGVGKTTTIAKIASYFKLKEGRSVALLTTDTYRIAAKDQLQVYAGILDLPLLVVMEDDDINEAVEKERDHDLILIDTSGFSHHNEEQKAKMKKLLSAVDPSYEKRIFLVLSATTSYRDLKSIVDAYKEFTSFTLIFTKLDETESYGPILSTKLYSDADLSYVSTGQDVPDDIEVLDVQRMVKLLLGGK